MAPETLRRPQLWSPKSDVWSFGVLMYEVFNNGVKPWLNEETKRIAMHIRKGKMPGVPTCTPVPIKEMLARIWSLSPEARPTMDDICRQLKILHKGDLKVTDPSKLTIKRVESSTRIDTYTMDESHSLRSTFSTVQQSVSQSVLPSPLKMSNMKPRKPKTT